MAYEVVPAEVRSCPQWIAWRRVWNQQKAKFDKLPVSPVHGRLAATNNPADWASFEHAEYVMSNYGEQHALSGLGFVFGYASGIGGFDLDDVFDAQTGKVLNPQQLSIVEKFNTYTEYSPSGTGLHGLFYGDIPEGRRTQGVELYGQGRFFTVTGVPFRQVPLRNCQYEADELRKALDIVKPRASRADLNWSAPQTISDEELWRRCSTGQTSAMFLRLWAGNWREDFPNGSQSEADIALANLICFWTDCPSQASRMWWASGLAQRLVSGAKVKHRNYVPDLIAKGFDKKVPMIDLTAITAQVARGPVQPAAQVSTDQLAVLNTPIEPPRTASVAPVKLDEDATEAAWLATDVYTRPAGLVGDIMDYIQASAPYPHKEMGLATALTIMAGICGRQFQVNSAGLNLYTMVLADTGMGKEQMTNGANAVMNSIIRPEVDITTVQAGKVDASQIGFPAAKAFMGPSKLTGKGLLRMFDKGGVAEVSLSSFCIFSEFAGTLGKIASIGRQGGGADSGIIDLKSHLLEIFMKSSAGQVYGGSLTADKENSVGVLLAPSFTFLCENTPQGIWEILSEQLVRDGLLPRMLIIEVPRRDRNAVYNPGFASVKVPSHLTQRLTYLCKLVFEMKQSHDRRIDVQFAPGAAQRLDEYRMFANDQLDGSNADTYRDLWNRAHLIVSKVAALLAIGTGGGQPTISVEQVDYAARLVTRQVTLLIGKFKRGEVGQVNNIESTQYEIVYRTIAEYMSYGAEDLPKKWAGSADLRRANIVSYSDVQRTVHRHAAFRDPRAGGPTGIKRTIEALVRAGVLTEQQITGKSGKHYLVSLA